MNYLEMILSESAEAESKKNSSSNKINISGKKALAAKKSKIAAIERILTTGIDSSGKQISENRKKALIAQLAAEKESYNKLKQSLSQKKIADRFGNENAYKIKKAQNSLTLTGKNAIIGAKKVGADVSDAASAGIQKAKNYINSKKAVNETAYLEGYYAALEDAGYDYDDYDYDDYDYDDYDSETAYLEGYYAALEDAGYDYD